MRRIFTGLLLSAVLVSGCSTLTQVPQTQAAQAITSGNYTLDANHAALIFTVSHFGLSSYTGRFSDISAQLDFDEDNPSDSRLSAQVNVSSLQVTPQSFVEKLIGPDWLNAGEHPTASFNVSGITVTGENTGQASGTLTLNGITRPHTFDVQFIGGAVHPKMQKYAIGFDASAQFKRSDFGIDNLLSVAGDKFDFDTITLDFNGEFVKG